MTPQQYATNSTTTLVDFDEAKVPAGPHYYPISLKAPTQTGELLSHTVRPSLWRLWATGPFRYKGFMGGDSLSTVHVPVDTMSASLDWEADAVHLPHGARFPCFTTIYGALDSLRVTPAASDTLYIQGYVEMPYPYRTGYRN